MRSIADWASPRRFERLATLAQNLDTNFEVSRQTFDELCHLRREMGRRDLTTEIAIDASALFESFAGLADGAGHRWKVATSHNTSAIAAGIPSNNGIASSSRAIPSDTGVASKSSAINCQIRVFRHTGSIPSLVCMTLSLLPSRDRRVDAPSAPFHGADERQALAWPQSLPLAEKTSTAARAARSARS